MRVPFLLLLLLTCPLWSAAQTPANLLISEIMQNPRDVLDFDGEWLEVFNPTDDPIDLKGWTLRDLDNDLHTIRTTVLVPAEGFAVLCRKADRTANGGLLCHYEYADFQLANSADEIILTDEGGVEIDRVVYDGGPDWPDPNGASMVFTGRPTDDNNDPKHWVASLERQATYSGGGTDTGSPGSAGNLQGALPVELTAFEAVADAGTVVLTWTTANELNNAGFDVQRSLDTDRFETVGFVDGKGTTAIRQHYTYRIPDLAPGRHVFRLKQVDYDGTVAYSPSVEIALELAEAVYLSDAYPNPFNPSTRFSVTVPTRQDVTVAVYSLLGRQVQVLFDGPLEAQVPHAFSFDAGALPSGLYLYRVTGASFSATKPIMLVK